jgi:hypothetical protein
MSKPQGYLNSASEALLCLLILVLPYYQSLFCESLCRVLLFCLLTFLLLFLAKHSEDIAQAIHRCILALCAGIVLPERGRYEICFVLPARAKGHPILTPLFKRPPPSLLAFCL